MQLGVLTLCPHRTKLLVLSRSLDHLDLPFLVLMHKIPFKEVPMMHRLRHAPILTLASAGEAPRVVMPINAPTVEGQVTQHTVAEHPGLLDSVPAGLFPLPPSAICRINLRLFLVFLEGHPDPYIVDFLKSGFTDGFRVGFITKMTPGRKRPLSSSNDVSEDISTAILKEMNRGHTKGPFTIPPFKNFHLSPLGGVPKPDGSIRVILDLSSPRGSSVNDGISREAFSVKYSKFDDAVDLAATPTGCFMGKRDIRHAFRLCPIHPEDWALVVYWWKGKYYVDIVLPFGLRSSPYIFNTFADSLGWICKVKGGIKDMLHYLDDYFFTGSSVDICTQAMNQFDRICNSLNIPLAEDKKEGPCQTITFLGIEIDTLNRCCRLPDKKLKDLLGKLQGWNNASQTSKRELLSLIGSLSFAAKVIKPGRTFMRRLIDLSTSVTELSDIVEISEPALEDIKWWSDFAPRWNGTAFFQDPVVTSEHLDFFTDASGFGIGAVLGPKWFSVALPASAQGTPIHILEFVAVAMAVITWADNLVNKQVTISTDNLDIVLVWRSGSCKDKLLMKLVRHLFLFIARMNINILLVHLPGKDNVFADLLSRLQVGRFLSLAESASPEPSRIPEEAWEILDLLETVY